MKAPSVAAELEQQSTVRDTHTFTYLHHLIRTSYGIEANPSTFQRDCTCHILRFFKSQNFPRQINFPCLQRHQYRKMAAEHKGDATVFVAPDNTCGYQDGKEGKSPRLSGAWSPCLTYLEYPITCVQSKAHCVFVSSKDYPAVVNCCVDMIACALSAPTACLDREDAAKGGICKEPDCGKLLGYDKTFIWYVLLGPSVSPRSDAEPFLYSGHSLYPYCASITYAGVNAVGWNNCGASGQKPKIVKTTYDGQKDRRLKTQLFNPTPPAAETTHVTLTGTNPIGVLPTPPTTTQLGPVEGIGHSTGTGPAISASKAGIIAAGIIGGLIAFLAVAIIIRHLKKAQVTYYEEENLPESPLTTITAGPSSSEPPESVVIPLTPVPTQEPRNNTIDNSAEIATATLIVLTPMRPMLVSAAVDESKPELGAARNMLATEMTVNNTPAPEQMTPKIQPKMALFPSPQHTTREEPLSQHGSIEEPRVGDKTYTAMGATIVKAVTGGESSIRERSDSQTSRDLQTWLTHHANSHGNGSIASS